MSARWFAVVLVAGICLPCVAQQESPSEDEATLRSRIESYVATFNAGDAAAVIAFWTADGVSVAEETGDRTEGREALLSEFAAFFDENPGARLTGDIDTLRMVRPDVAVVEGRTSLFIEDLDPVESAFTAIIVKENDKWLISSSHERDLPTPSSSYQALRELEWLVGSWQDQSDKADVTTTVRWSPNQAFLIRSFNATLEEDETLEGTQIIGWDPLNKQIRSWTFNSDGSFGHGTLSRHDDDWMLKMWQVTSDGRLATGTKVMTRIDDDTLTVRTIGETVDGEAVPSSASVTVIRTSSVPSEGQTGDTP